jgi:hypothetical protein
MGEFGASPWFASSACFPRETEIKVLDYETASCQKGIGGLVLQLWRDRRARLAFFRGEGIFLGELFSTTFPWSLRLSWIFVRPVFLRG